MTPEQTKAAASIMLAWAEGKKVEAKSRHGSYCGISGVINTGNWQSDSNPDWSWNFIDYRLAPEPPKKKRVELAEYDFVNMPVVWVRNPDTKPQMVLCFGVSSIGLSNMNISYIKLMEEGWLYSQNRSSWTPCWKEIEVSE